MNKTQKLNEDSYGEKITLLQSNEMINEFLDLDKVIEKKVMGTASQFQKPKAQILCGKTYNAFIFTKDLIMRFFDGSEVDEHGNPKSANFLMVVLGAHARDKGNEFKAGSFTVLTAGCERVIESNGDVKFYALNVLHPANEYPPYKLVSSLKPRNGQQTIEFFMIE